MAITGQTFTKSFVVAGQKFYAADFLVLIAELQALNDEVVSEAIANAGAQAVGGVKTFSSAPVFAAGANMGSAKVTAVLDPTANQDAATKKYTDNKSVDGTPTAVYTKYFTGTTDADATTNVAHGVTAANILHVSAAIFHLSTAYFVYDFQFSASAPDAFTLSYNATNIVLGNVGTNNRSRAYRIKIDYTT